MSTSVPNIIAGPILRHVTKNQLTFWMVTRKAETLRFCLNEAGNNSLLIDRELNSKELQQIQIGQHAFINLISINTEQPLPEEQLLEYDFRFLTINKEPGLSDLITGLCYPNQSLASFTIKSKINKILHGSCRKPHFDSGDGLRQIDKLLATTDFHAADRPALIMMSGDQIYADDVAGPMLVAIHQVINLLGLFDEKWQGATVNNSNDLFDSPFCYYQRQHLLPQTPANRSVYDKIFVSSEKPIFTSVNTKNHLVTLAEVMAMYLLVWSPELWPLVDLENPNIAEEFIEQYQSELPIIKEFSVGLTEVRRAMAHVPVYMIFDDHDVTDDWNLTRGWEEAAYGHPFSKQILGNALIGYWLCQGWGNTPDKFTSLMEESKQYFSDQGVQNQLQLIDVLLEWDQWHYNLQTSPKIVVLDTRTQRWRSENNANKPSGLMDWEALSELQQELINQECVIMISPAPVYGVKAIEAVQRIFTFVGLPLMVDAENWMAHPGTANVMLNIFRHQKTPPNFIILSGDVHYSFVYEITHRFRKNSSRIMQITSSGIKNQFPSTLLRWLDTINQYLYATYSPLNWFTKRRRMKIKVHKPSANSKHNLFNGSGIGQVTLSHNGEQIKAEIITVEGEKITFG